MKWYGNVNPLYLKKSIKNLKRLCNLKTKSLNFVTSPKINFKPVLLYFYIPFSWHCVFFKQQSTFGAHRLFYFYNEFYFFNLPVAANFTSLKFDPNARTILFLANGVNNFTRVFRKLITIVYQSFTLVFFKKIKFKGKGYYVFKNLRNTIAPQFGYSHQVKIYSYFLSVKFLSKTAILFFGINKHDVFLLSHTIRAVKPINIFTGKGIRFSKQIIYRKTGKVSSYR